MKIRTHSTAALACVVLAVVSAPVLADGPVVTASRKANDSGVTLQYQFSGNPRVGGPIAITLKFDGVTSPEGATVRLSPDAGLTLSGNDRLTLPPGTAVSVTVSVVSDREGLAYLNVFIVQGSARSAVSIPVQTGSDAPAARPAGEVKSMPGGEKIIALPAK